MAARIRKRLNGSGAPNNITTAIGKRGIQPRKLKVLGQLSAGDFPALRPVEALCKLGLTNAQVAEVLGVSHRQFKRWMERSDKLKASVARGRRVADSHVAESMYMQAIGFSVPEEKIFYSAKRDKVIRVETERYHPPNVVAGIFWLKNRFAEYWRDKKEIEIDGGPQAVQQVKFILVQGGQSQRGGGEVLDANYQILPNTSNADTAEEGEVEG